jgi:hypothetical protein
MDIFQGKLPVCDNVSARFDAKSGAGKEWISPLCEPLRPLLARLGGELPSSVAELNELARAAPVPVLSGGGHAIRFVTAGASAENYEARIFGTGQVPTRPGNWHDFFNALVWLAFPRTKAALNARHLHGMERQGAAGDLRRGALRDAATLFDECGVIVLSAEPQLTELLRGHQWSTLFWHRRHDVIEGMRFHVFGHATYDQLRAPFPGLCGKAVFLAVGRDLLARPVEEQLPAIDAELALRWCDDSLYRLPRELAPLPLLGIPGVTPESECPEYYDDTRQFRPARSDRARHGQG